MEKITKGREEIRLGVRQFKGKVFVDIRTWYTDESGALKPSPRGVTIPLDKFEEFKTCLSKIDVTKVDEELDIQ